MISVEERDNAVKSTCVVCQGKPEKIFDVKIQDLEFCLCRGCLREVSDKTAAPLLEENVKKLQGMFASFSTTGGQKK